MKIQTFALLTALVLTFSGCAQEEDPPVATSDPVAVLDEWVSRIDPEGGRTAANVWQFALQDRAMIVVADVNANRMRIMTPIIEADKVSAELHERMLVANFDAALDARYAIGEGYLWSTFIHPLAGLSAELFFSATGQVYNAAATFGTTFTSGALVYGGGDSSELNRELLERLESLAGDDQI